MPLVNRTVGVLVASTPSVLITWALHHLPTSTGVAHGMLNHVVQPSSTNHLPKVVGAGWLDDVVMACSCAAPVLPPSITCYWAAGMLPIARGKTPYWCSPGYGPPAITMRTQLPSTALSCYWALMPQSHDRHLLAYAGTLCFGVLWAWACMCPRPTTAPGHAHTLCA